MSKQITLFVALGLVAVGLCHAAGFPSKGDNLVDSRPIIEAEEQGRLYSAPVFEDVVFTEAKRNNDIKYIKNIVDRLIKLQYAIIIEKKGYFKIAGQALSLLPSFNSFLSDSRKLAKTDTSPPVKSSFGLQMSQMIKDVLSRNTELDLPAEEVFQRAQSLLRGIEKLVEKSPVGMYLDWTRFTVDGEPLPDHAAPIIKYLRKNGYGRVLSLLDMIGGLFKNLGKRE